ncbi:MAG: Beta-glucuronidase, partial [Verrucomicrobiota bacterium]
MKRCLPLLCLAISAAQAWSPEPTAMTNAAAHEVLSLNGRWNTIVDPNDNGYFNYRLEPFDATVPATGGYFLDRKPATPSELIEYDFDQSPVLNVPGDWNSQDDKLLYYEGTVWYRRKFDFTPSAPDKRQFIHFGGANYEAHVYLNGKKLGVHVGGFTPFQFEVTGLLRPTGNSLVVRVNNQRHPEGVPTINTDWWNYGGLTRDVALLETPALFIRDYTLALQRGTTDRITGRVQLDHYAGDTTVTVAIPELNFSTSAAVDRSGYAGLDFTVPGLTLWSPDNPKLYTVTFSAAGETVQEKIGFRTIETRGHDLLLNGKSVFLRGISL